jgi:hypothetical protein
MMVKLLMSWDIQPGMDAEYFEFIVREFAPGITHIGLQPTEAWFTIYGEGPQVLAGGIAEDLSTMKGILDSNEWDALHKKLLEYVTNYRHKVVRATGSLQIF